MSLRGKVYITAFVEENVQDVEENPKGYMGKESKGALHRVRYDKNFFFKMVRKANFCVDEFHHQLIERTGQSVLVLSKVD